jgi:alkyl hydroperoxide reductase subunit AhpC
LSVRDARYKLKKKKTNVLCFALRPLDEAKEFNSQNPNSSTSVYRNIFFLAFFFLDFSPLAFTCLGAGMKRNKTKREENEYVVLYTTLNGGSLGSWIDEERSKVR